MALGLSIEQLIALLVIYLSFHGKHQDQEGCALFVFWLPSLVFIFLFPKLSLFSLTLLSDKIHFSQLGSVSSTLAIASPASYTIFSYKQTKERETELTLPLGLLFDSLFFTLVLTASLGL